MLLCILRACLLRCNRQLVCCSALCSAIPSAGFAALLQRAGLLLCKLQSLCCCTSLCCSCPCRSALQMRASLPSGLLLCNRELLCCSANPSACLCCSASASRSAIASIFAALQMPEPVCIAVHVAPCLLTHCPAAPTPCCLGVHGCRSGPVLDRDLDPAWALDPSARSSPRSSRWREPSKRSKLPWVRPRFATELDMLRAAVLTCALSDLTCRRAKVGQSRQGFQEAAAQT